MRTKMPISSISYNSFSFLNRILCQLLECKSIDFYAFIKHKGEDDECGKKDHFHIYLEPCSIIDTSNINEMLLETDIDCSKPPLKSMPFRCSKFDDWCMYAIHDKQYCYAKGLVKKYAYKIDDIYTNDKDFLGFKYGSIDQLKITPYYIIQEALQNQLRFEDLLSTGRIPIQMIRNYQYAYDSISSLMTFKDKQGEFVYLEDDETFEEMIERKDDESQLDYLSKQSDLYLERVKKRNDKFRDFRAKWYEKVL